MKKTLGISLFLMAAVPASAQGPGRPIIDVHLHAGPGNPSSARYAVRPGESPDAARIRALISEMDTHNIVLGVIGGPVRYSKMTGATQPERFLVSLSFPCTDGLDPSLHRCFEDGSEWPKSTWLENEIKDRRIQALGELYGVYYGISPQNSVWDPYYQLAQRFDLPLIVHVGAGPPPNMRTPGCCPNFRGEYGDPRLFARVLERFPGLRVVLLHAFDAEAAIELMQRFPNVYVETSPMSLVPQPFVHGALRKYKEAGMLDRVVFGSDYPEIGKSTATIEAADFLTAEEKRAIFYDNAARFLRLPPEVVARHHAVARN